MGPSVQALLGRPVAITALTALLHGSTGCVAYRAATPGWLNGEPSTAPHSRAERSHAIRRRGVIAISAGAGELLIAGAVVVALATGAASGGVSRPGEDNPGLNPDCALCGIGDAGDEALAFLLLSALGGFIAVDGISNVICGAIDLASSSTCDDEVRAWNPEEATPAGRVGPPIAAEPARALPPPIAAEPVRAEPSPIAAEAPARPPRVDPTLLGDFERRDSDGGRVLRLTDDGRFRTAADRANLDQSRFDGLGTWRLEGDQLTLISAKGICAESSATQVGVYRITAAKVGLRFARLSDACGARASLDAQTWWRIR